MRASILSASLPPASRAGRVGFCFVLSFGAAIALAGASFAGTPRGRAFTWMATGDLPVATSDHTATLLPDGRVLVAGGISADIGASAAQLYDPATGEWTLVEPMKDKRTFATATLLANGQVLLAGGEPDNNSANKTLSACELYDPAIGHWTDTGSMNSPRFLHTATLLRDGRVLVTGGDSTRISYDSCEIYDPATGIWTTTGSMYARRVFHTATLFANGMSSRPGVRR